MVAKSCKSSSTKPSSIRLSRGRSDWAEGDSAQRSDSAEARSAGDSAQSTAELDATAQQRTTTARRGLPGDNAGVARQRQGLQEIRRGRSFGKRSDSAEAGSAGDSAAGDSAQPTTERNYTATHDCGAVRRGLPFYGLSLGAAPAQGD